MARRVPLRLLVVALSSVAVLAASATGALIMSAGAHPGPSATRGVHRSARLSRPPAPVSVVAIAPADGSTGVPPGSLVVVRFSAPVDLRGGDPALSPPVPGLWAQPQPAVLIFRPDSPLPPDSTVTLTVGGAGPGGAIRGVDGGALTEPAVSRWRVAGGSVLRIQEVLAGLGYLPVAFQPVGPEPPTFAAQVAAAFSPPPGVFSWRWGAPPPALASLWHQGIYDTMTQAAVMAFESDSGLASDGLVGPQVWAALLQAASKGSPRAAGYSFVQVSKTLPQHLVVWHNGSVVLSAPVNTGVHGAETPAGTWPVYARYQATTMRGTDPDGTHYNDPGVPFVNYFHGGDAIHGFPRARYGYPQSNGCVELPVAAAQVAFGLLHIGSLVTVGA